MPARRRRRPSSAASTSPPRRSSAHDAYVEVTGPSATDVHHNFVAALERGQRTSRAGRQLGLRRQRTSCRCRRRLPRAASGTQQPCRSSAMLPRASSGRSSNSTNARSMPPRRTIYIENQAIPIPRVAAAPGARAGARRRCRAARAGDSRGSCLCRAQEPGAPRAVRRHGGARASSGLHASSASLRCTRASAAGLRPLPS